jgi:hypothetical protein
MTDQLTPVVDLDAGYENVTALCPRCGRRNVYNRVTDIGHVDAIDSHHLACQAPACGDSFWVRGDLVNTAYAMLLLDSCDFVREKRYMQAVLAATTAYELFFAHFLRVELLYRPLRRDESSVDDEIGWLDAAAARLRAKTARHTFEPMRRIFLRAALDNVAPATLVAAAAYVDAIPAKPSVVLRTDIEQLDATDEPRRGLLLGVWDAKIADLRNNIVHKGAYRPSLAETQTAVEDACTIINSLSAHFKMRRDEFHLNEHLT